MANPIEFEAGAREDFDDAFDCTRQTTSRILALPPIAPRIHPLPEFVPPYALRHNLSYRASISRDSRCDV